MNNTDAACYSDHELTCLMNQEDDAVLNLLFRKYWSPLMNYAGNYITDHDTCKEIVQELFVTLHIKRSQLKIEISLSSYLYRSLHNKILNYLRDQSVYNKHLTIASRRNRVTNGHNDVEEFITVMEINKELHNCLNRMPAKYKEVYVLHKQRGFTLRKTSELLQRPVDTVEKQFRKAVHFLRNHLVIV
ncbi:MAG: sigma-70 family RNA polymerase sigma factor [Chitinophagaceae bacterium]